MKDETKGFTVKDRRHFTPDGEVRGDADALPLETAEAPRPAPSAPAPASAPSRRAAPSNGADFGSFLISLGAQAGALLDDDKDPEALLGAQQIISIIEMLQDKTEGRRTEDEERVIQGLLYELRMAYVERTRMARA